MIAFVCFFVAIALMAVACMFTYLEGKEGIAAAIFVTTIGLLLGAAVLTGAGA